jgi:hypothetical protein
MTSPKTLDPDSGNCGQPKRGSLGRLQFEDVPAKAAEDEKGRRHR